MGRSSTSDLGTKGILETQQGLAQPTTRWECERLIFQPASLDQFEYYGYQPSTSVS